MSLLAATLFTSPIAGITAAYGDWLTGSYTTPVLTLAQHLAQ